MTPTGPNGVDWPQWQCRRGNNGWLGPEARKHQNLEHLWMARNNKICFWMQMMNNKHWKCHHLLAIPATAVRRMVNLVFDFQLILSAFTSNSFAFHSWRQSVGNFCRDSLQAVEWSNWPVCGPIPKGMFDHKVLYFLFVATKQESPEKCRKNSEQRWTSEWSFCPKWEGQQQQNPTAKAWTIPVGKIRKKYKDINF